MSIWIVQNAYADRILGAFRLICDNDLGLRLAEGGMLRYVQSVSGVGPDLLTWMIEQNVSISVRGELPTYFLGKRLLFGGGTVLIRNYPLIHVEVVVDVVGGMTGLGFYGLDANQRKIDLPLDVVLIHELGHAHEALVGNTDIETDYAYAVRLENQYRKTHRMPLGTSTMAACTAPLVPDTCRKTIRGLLWEQTRHGEGTSTSIRAC
jgi:hypothetical protein